MWRFCLGSLLLLTPAFASAQTLQQDLHALDLLRKGFDTDLDAVNRRGDELLEKYEEPQEQAQVYFMLAHVHSQSGMQRPKEIRTLAKKALESKLIAPDQRATLYSYLASTHEADREVKDFAERRRKAIAPLLAGLKELTAFNLPEKAPELPLLVPGVIGDREAVERRRAEAERAQAARERAKRIGELIFRRNVLRDQIKGLYLREPPADDELQELASEVLGDEAIGELLTAIKTERERIAKARKERDRIK